MRPCTLDLKTKHLLQRRAQLMRTNPSAPERALWFAIRSGQLGVAFRRQAVLGRYIVDFVAPQAKLVVEVDGQCHERRRAADARRDRKLACFGYRVLRLEAQLVLTNLPMALTRMRLALAETG
jgi:very-short-patch-repair endonuclease